MTPARHAGIVALAVAVLVSTFFWLDGAAVTRGRGPSGLKVTIVGLDGATTEVLSPLLAAGRLPNLARFVARAGGGHLHSAVDRYTSAALWTTIVTGVEPERHGILDFVMPLPDDPSRKVPSASGHRTAKALWEMLDSRGLRSAIVGLWATWPAERVAGAVVSDRVTYSRMRLSRSFRDEGRDIAYDFDTLARTVHPVALRRHVDRRVLLPHEIEPQVLRFFADLDETEVARIRDADYGGDFNIRTDPFQELKVTVQSDRSYADIGLMLRERVDPAMLLVYLEGVDVMEHAFWPHRVGLDSVPAADRARFQGVVDRYYEYTDALIEPYLARAGDDEVVIVLSDHGYMTVPGHVSGHWHSPNAVFFAAGGPIAQGAVVGADARLADVTPTILHLLGLPVADDLDGRVLTEILDEQHLRDHPVQRIASYGARRLRPGDIAESPEDEDYMRRLQGLGYLGGKPDG